MTAGPHERAGLLTLGGGGRERGREGAAVVAAAIGPGTPSSES